MVGISFTGVSGLVLEVGDLEAAERFYAALHIAEDDFDGAVERPGAHGYDPEVLETSGRAAYVSDPDGNVVELWTWDVAGHLR